MPMQHRKGKRVGVENPTALLPLKGVKSGARKSWCTRLSESRHGSGPLLPPFPNAVRVFAETNDVVAKVGSQPQTIVPPPYGSGPEATA